MANAHTAPVVSVAEQLRAERRRKRGVTISSSSSGGGSSKKMPEQQRALFFQVRLRHLQKERRLLQSRIQSKAASLSREQVCLPPQTQPNSISITTTCGLYRVLMRCRSVLS